jgi:glyoxylase-like metal-dependent hydrolase (beta-lactamase superfamily II)
MEKAQMTQPDQRVPIDDLVNAGEAQSAAIEIAPGIFMSKDVSNVYLVKTEDGDILINAGSSKAAERHKTLFEAAGAGRQAYVIITQSHGDHYGGLAKLKSPDAKLIVQARYPDGVDYRRKLSGFYVPRTNRLWHLVVGRRMDRSGKAPPEFTPDVLVEDNFAFSLGERRFELLAVPGGETLDSLAIWLPQERIVFTGNMLGPAWLNIPNLNTVRGDKPRSAQDFIRAVDRIRALKPDMLVTGHGEPIRGAPVVEDGLKHVRDAVQSTLDQTIAGMNAGKDVHTLMREVQVPSELGIEEWHGKTAWNVRAIWHEYAGWFHYDSTTALYDVPAARSQRMWFSLLEPTPWSRARSSMLRPNDRSRLCTCSISFWRRNPR